MKWICLVLPLQLGLASMNAQESLAPTKSPPEPVAKFASPRDGSHDFDFLIGNWKAHVRRLPERLVGSTTWVEYDGISNHKKLLDTNANFEEFDVNSPASHLHIKAQTLRMYNPESHQWSIYLVDLDKGTLEVPPVVGQFTGNRGEFYNRFTISNNGRAPRSWSVMSG